MTRICRVPVAPARLGRYNALDSPEHTAQVRQWQKPEETVLCPQ